MSSTEKSLITKFFIFLLIRSCFSIDTITPNQPLRDGDILVSSGKVFALGFFSPGNSGNRYVGVWYYQVPNQTVVWVANRDHPVDDRSGFLAVQGDGGLVVYGKDQKVPLWSSNVTLSSPNNSLAKLLDSGNLVLLENGVSQNVLWEGFNYPSNTFLPFMKVGVNRQSGIEWYCTSWKSQDDPGTGNCSYRIDPRGFPQLILYKDGAPWWRAGTWTGQRFSGVPVSSPNFIFNSNFVNNQDEISIMYDVTNASSIYTRTVLDETGTIARSTWNGDAQEWNVLWSAPVERCDYYGRCGPNSNCAPDYVASTECTCLPGFVPKSPADWYLRDGSGGCIREKGVSICGNGDGFVKIVRVKIPESSTASVNMNLSLKACEQECWRNCSCTAYSAAGENKGGIGCVTWHEDLMDTRTFSSSGQDLYVRVNATILAQYAKSNGSPTKKAKLAISIVSVLLFFFVVFLVYWLVKRKLTGKKRPNKFESRVPTGSMYFEKSTADLDDQSTMNSSELPFFDLRIISAATNNFSASNKLGAGGFGSVYKGVLSNGKEIAVKRLSKHSGQGIEEFKNEVMLIAKLQHRNLVKILGCCVQDEENMLIYEYVPNKSLDYFIFNETNRALLDWKTRFEIICGIARGILYLHQDSRLRIIHRDLKASNVLLDASLNPKIADFGLARIFRGDQNEANTNRVVGTYGYMSPEYAMEGLFSVKSDVYSFGILLLEIISGRKNSGYYDESYPDSNLVGHVWSLWREDHALEIVDSTLGDSFQFDEVLRCIQIALLCVQDFPTERPTMSAVLGMLSNDAALPPPGKPAFLVKKAGTSEDNSINNVTCTIVRAR
uniref:G-type lectin S-receptor-like serine/threonine-protein kinase At1g11410 isoform X1 n=1 Tax=Fragaria vesca subsp. vesca TaxID=101020 RepID=UPI0005CA7633|nr:PREDICTED: G-type lectin S-receptor-like serine/threonine-protein kinase At1g11410 isoform X1 [Fragaria vesca subsp. vesca]